MGTPPAERDPQLREYGHSVRRNSTTLAVIALSTATILGGVELATRQPIADARRAAAISALNEILPPGWYDNDLLQSAREMEFDGRSSTVYTARHRGRVVAVILSAVAPDGYTGAIEFLLGLRRDGSILGVRVTHHRETPGLGDKIDVRKSPWIRSFDGKSMSNTPAAQWRVKRDGGTFDQFTGATITPRAMVSAVHRYFEQANRQHHLLFHEAPMLPGDHSAPGSP